MARKSPEKQIQWLASVRDREPGASAVERVESCLCGANSAVAAAAARCVARCGLEGLVPVMADAFHRFIERPETDKGCLAKTAIVEALEELGRRDPGVFLSGARHVQMEASYGGPVDAAAELRALCGLALVRIGHHEAPYVLVDLLNDAEPGPRRAAAKALGFLGTREGELLLRAKCLSGDPEAVVSGECFAGLMAIAPDRSLDFVARFLDEGDEGIAQEAALAIGESRHPRAFGLLSERYRSAVRSEDRIGLLLPIALTRHEEAFEFLLAVVSDGAVDDARAALEALRVYDDRGQRRRRIERAVDERADATVSDTFRARFSR